MGRHDTREGRRELAVFGRERRTANRADREWSLEELPPGAAALAMPAIDEHCREFHFLRGRERYKYEWGAVDRWSTRRLLSREPAKA